jgi:endonuclease YncB( thermonuclease family)
MIGSFLAMLISVTDGDTFKARVPVWDGVEIVTAVRLKGIDTPELKGKCAAEKALALKAKARLAELLTGSIVISDITPDKFAGRVDAIVVANGQEVAGILVADGLARQYTGGARGSWCP